jgi:WD40 repeat protein
MFAVGTELLGRYRITAVLESTREAPLYRAVATADQQPLLIAGIALPDDSALQAALTVLRQVRGSLPIGVLPLLEIWSEDQTCWLVCPDPGSDFADVLTRRPLPFSEAAALDLVGQLLEPLSVLHQRTPPLLLGDLRLSDLHVDGDGRLQLLPAVLIRPLAVGTVDFAAPELQQSQQEPTPSGDVFAIGAFLYLLLSGRRSPQALVPLRTVRNDLHELTEPLLLRALDPRPANRYQQAREMLSALRTVALLRTAEPLPDAPSAAAAVVAAVPAAATSAAPRTALAQPLRRLNTGCLIAIVVSLLLAVLTFCGLLLLVAVFVFGPSNPFGVGSLTGWMPTAAAPAASADIDGLRAVAAAYRLGPDLRDSPLGPTAYSPDGRLVAVAVGSQIQLRDAGTFELRRTVDGTAGDISALSFSPDGALLAAGAQDDPLIRVWQTSDAQPFSQLSGHDGWIRSLAFAADGRLVSGGSDMTVRLWTVADGRLLQTFTGHSDMIGQVAVAPDGRRIASVSRDGTLRIWDPVSGVGTVRFTVPAAADEAVPAWLTGLAWHPAGDQMAVGSVNGNIYLIDAADTVTPPRVLSGHRGWIVIRGLAYSPDGRRLASAGLDGELRLWDTAAGATTATLREQGYRLLGLSWSADGSSLVTSSDVGGRVVVWDAAAGTLLGHAQVTQGAVATVAFAPDGSLLSSGIGGVLRIHAADGSSRTALRSVAPLRQAAVFVDNDLVAVIGDEGSLGLFSLSGQQEPRVVPLAAGAQAVSVAAASGSGLLAVGFADGRIDIRRISDLTLAAELDVLTTAVDELVFSSDGMQLAAVANGDGSVPQAVIWRHTTAATPVELALGSGTAALTGLAFSDDAVRLYATAVDGGLRVWTAQDGREQLRITADPTYGWFSDLLFLADQQLLAVATASGSLLFYRPADLLLIREVTLESGSIMTIGASADGRRIVAATDDAALIAVDAAP